MSRFTTTLGKRKSEPRTSDLNNQHVPFENPTVKRMHFTSFSDRGIEQLADVSSRIPRSAPPPASIPEPVKPVNEQSKKKRTQNGSLLDDYANAFGMLSGLRGEMHADADIESGVHLNNPFHWAQKWDPLQGFFVKHDISRLGHIIQLGHHGRPCPSSTGSRKFITVDHKQLHTASVARVIQNFGIQEWQEFQVYQGSVLRIRKIVLCTLE
ncbi:hypothetical protein B0H11DRAFT_1926051 [Mycena galericulata]|nr:hypothetical protein B0H11DRAFT_1926051 [Mycena galericulata]